MLAALNELLNKTRGQRLDKEICDALRARFGMLEDALVAHYVTLPRNARMVCRPQCIDFAFMPECRAIIDVPATETATDDQFADIVPTLIMRWEADIKKQLTDYIRPYLGEVDPDVDPLELAISFFFFNWKEAYVQGCDGYMRFPDILAHKCVRLRDCFRFHYGATDTLESGEAYTRTINSLGRLPQDRPQTMYGSEGSTCILTNHPFRFNPFHDADSEARQPAKAMRQLVSALGLDPARATFDDLKRCDI